MALHETTHDILPHQQDLLYADDTETLAASTHRLFEREANQGAAEPFFQRTRFESDAADMEISSAAIRALAESYGSSLHTAVRRYAETHPSQVAAIVLSRTPTTSNPPTWARQEFMATPGWTAQFGPAQWPRLMTATAYPFLAALTLPELGHVKLPDVDGNAITVQVDAFQTPYSSFVLLWTPQRRRLLPRSKIHIAA